MVYGYCRISTKQQSIDRQVRNIEEAFPDAAIYKEAFTGTKIDRPVFDRLLKQVKKDRKDGKPVTIVFDSVSRMSRDAEDGWQLYEELYSDDIELVFLKEPHINTDVYRAAQNGSIATVGNEIADEYIKTTNKVLMLLAQNQVKLAFAQAQKEVDDLHQRTREGIQTARIEGKQIGQRQGAKLNVKKAQTAKEAILKHSKDFGGTLDDAECLKLAECSRNSFYKYKRELREQN